MALTPNPSSPTVLVVEDEMVLRMRAVDIVEDAGFNSIEAVNADEALGILESRSDISLLFTDIQMPGTLDGLKLAHAVHKRWPAIKIILVSGQVDLSSADKPADSRFFGKPLETEQMISEIQDMVGAGALVITPLDAKQPVAGSSEEMLTAENGSLRLLLAQAAIDAKALLAQAGIEAKEREAADKLQKLIVDELHHRIKNTLATVSAIASQSLRTATSIDHGRQAIEGRLVALGRVHDLLMQVSWASSSLVDTIRGATEAYDSRGRFTIDGPDIRITSGAVIALAMTLNELCTNTTKFGALSVPTGNVEITWVTEQDRFQLTWRETNGPAVAAPTRRSFGTRMIGALGQQLHGDVKLIYEPTGFVYVLNVPLNSLTEKI
jgi:two-component sensor histidine kinase/ActR/RegA family two-component response regulator